jgi:hypothetical protein
VIAAATGSTPINWSPPTRPTPSARHRHQCHDSTHDTQVGNGGLMRSWIADPFTGEARKGPALPYAGPDPSDHERLAAPGSRTARSPIARRRHADSANLTRDIAKRAAR